MARTRQRWVDWTRSWLGAKRSARQPYREGELEVPHVDGTRTDPGDPPAGPPPDPPAPPDIALRAAGTWSTLITAPSAASTSIAGAVTLASELARVSGSAAPSRVSWNGTNDGVRVGLASEWVAAGVSLPVSTWDAAGWDWALVKIGGQPYVLGRTDRGLQVAVRRLLHTLGYHQLTTVWEVFPALGNNVPMVNDEVRKLKLRFMTGFAATLLYPPVTEGQARLDVWEARNGLIDDGGWPAGHSWAQIKSQFQSEFNLHPEYLAGDGSGNKLCVFEPGVVSAAIAFAQSKIAAKPTLKSVSMAAADGSLGWSFDCSGTHEQLTSSPANRQLRLANQVQLVVGAGPAEHYTAIQCYGDASFPSPSIACDPGILVIWTSAFIFGGLSPEQAIAGYFAKGCVLHAPYGYFSEWPWDFDLPCKARATKRAELTKEHERIVGLAVPAIGSAGESTAAWVPFGRWYWSLLGELFGDDPLSRWDSWPSLVFPSAPTQAAAWFSIVDTPVPFSTDLLNRMASSAAALIQALPLGSAERERALDLGRWTVYADYYKRYAAAPSATTLEPMLRWCFRFRHRDVTAYAAPYILPSWLSDRRAVAAKYGLTDLTYASAVWPDTATTDAEVLSLLATVVSTNALIPFTVVGFSTDLLRVTGLVHAGTRGTFVEETKSAIGDQAWWYHSTTGRDVFTFKGGVVSQSKGPDHVRIYDWATGETVWEQDIPADKISRDTSASQSFYPEVVTIAQRVYRIEITARGGLTWSWQAGTGVSLIPSRGLNLFTASNSWYFYVPVGTTEVGFYGAGSLRFVGPDGVDIASVTAQQNYYSVPVPEDKDGVPWKVVGINGGFELLTVPPEVAQDENELMLPREVIEADGLSLADAIPIPTPDYLPVSFSASLVPHVATLSGTTNGSYNYLNHTGTVGYLYAIGTTQVFSCQGGKVSSTRGNSVLVLTDLTNSSTQTITVTNQDKSTVDYTVNTVPGRLYRLDFTVVGGSVAVTWGVSTQFSFVAQGQATLQAVFNPTILSGWVYVPKGTTRVGWWAQAGTSKWYDNTNKLITTVVNSSDYHSFPVPAGKDGTCMRFSGFSGRFEPQTVPPFWALRPSQLLIPAEVVAADGI